MEELILAYGSGEIEPTMAGMAWCGSKNKELADHIFINTGSRNIEDRKWVETLNSQWCTSSNTASSLKLQDVKGSVIYLNNATN